MTVGTNLQKNQPLHILGAGLAGTECALQLASKGFSVFLYEMRSKELTPAHKTSDFAELVCSNSFGSLNPESAPGQLKWEAEQMGSFILKAAHLTAIPAGQALGVDRELFSKLLSQWVNEHPNITVIHKIISSLDELPRPAIIATGPLTHPFFAESLKQHFGDDFLYFFDAISPIVDAETIDHSRAWKQDRYNKGSADYLNCPLNQTQYENLISEILNARKITPKDFEITPFFEGCMPIEVMAERGPDTLRFGPMKPVGLTDPSTGKEPYAAVQLRQENNEATAYNLVGFQTRMAFGEQVRVLRMIPGLEKAEFFKLGSIHRNLYINSRRCLNKNLSSKKNPQLYFAGQITGVEGYFESTCIGLLLSELILKQSNSEEFNPPPPHSAMGALLHAITDYDRADHFQPTNINFGLLPKLNEEDKKILGKDYRSKQKRRLHQLQKAKQTFSTWLNK